MNLQIETPTTKDRGSWLICTSPLGCGTRILQGWSEGIGVQANKRDFEDKLAKLLMWSDFSFKNPTPVGHIPKFWGFLELGGEMEAPIGVSRRKVQFLHPKQTYILSSLVPWINRFEEFVKKHNLGDFSKSHEWVNHNYKGDANVTALWTWNGTCPTAAALGLSDWANNPENFGVKTAA